MTDSASPNTHPQHRPGLPRDWRNDPEIKEILNSWGADIVVWPDRPLGRSRVTLRYIDGTERSTTLMWVLRRSNPARRATRDWRNDREIADRIKSWGATIDSWPIPARSRSRVTLRYSDGTVRDTTLTQIQQGHNPAHRGVGPHDWRNDPGIAETLTSWGAVIVDWPERPTARSRVNLRFADGMKRTTLLAHIRQGVSPARVGREPLDWRNDHHVVANLTAWGAEVTDWPQHPTALTRVTVRYADGTERTTTPLSIAQGRNAPRRDQASG
jgi:hypothetical protein